MSFELRVEFAGLCVYVVDTDRGRVDVLLPDCRNVVGVDPEHVVGEVGAYHVGYVRYDLASVMEGVPRDKLEAPSYEVVHKFDGQTVHFGIDPTGVQVPRLDLPDLKQYAPTLDLVPGMLDGGARGELLMHTVLEGGTLTATSPGDVWEIAGTLHPDGTAYRGEFAGNAEWTVTVEGDDLPVRIASFDGSSSHTVRLRPVQTEKGLVLALKIANLCAYNPLEWDELDLHEVNREDVDFRWSYRLLKPHDGELGDMVDAESGRLLPVPVLVTEEPSPQGRLNCFGLKLVRESRLQPASV